MSSRGLFSRMDLQWFGDLVFEEEDDEPEIVKLETDEVPQESEEEDELPDPYKGKSKKEIVDALQELSKKADSAEALQKGVAELGDKLGKSSRQVVDYSGMRPQQPGESDEEFFKRFNQEIFGEDPSKAMDEFVQRRMGPVQQYYGQQLVEMKKEVLRNDAKNGEMFREYEDEVNEFIATLQPQVRNNPQVVQYAFDEVKKRHQDDIIEKKVQERFDELMKEKGKSKGDSGVFRTESSTSNVGMQSKGKKSKLYITPEIEREALRRGVTPEVYAAWKKRQGGS